MANLYTLMKQADTQQDEELVSRLLATDQIDAGSRALYGTGGTLEPDTTNRTLFIGLGGTGVQTINKIKGVVSQRLKANWKEYIAFLGIDTDYEELSRSVNLEPGEYLNITLPDVEKRYADRDQWPLAAERFMPDPSDVTLPGLNTPGAGRSRLTGKAKFHDKQAASKGVDEQILSKIREIKNSRFAPFLATDPGTYEVYVIGSAFGGTCSGALLEMPAVIREAIKVRCTIHAILYLPDTMEQRFPELRDEFYANGYATLKELDYFMGTYMRPGYAERWGYNDPANPELHFASRSSLDPLIDMPYLVGTHTGGNPKSMDTAKDTIAEFLISILAQVSVTAGTPFLTESFVSNAIKNRDVRTFMPGTNDTREAAGECHDFPKCYAAIGFAKAEVPYKIVRAYTVGQVCNLAGIAPVSAEERAKIQTTGGGAGKVTPFRDKKDLLNATAGTAKAREIIAPLAGILGQVHCGSFAVKTDIPAIANEITWKKLHDSNITAQGQEPIAAGIITNRTGAQAQQALENKIKEAFTKFRKNVQEYVREEGPYAFVNLFNGNFAPVNNDYGTGVRKMIENLVEGKTITGQAYNYTPVQTALANLNNQETLIHKTGILEVFKHNDQCSKWIDLFNAYQKARIDEKFREISLGRTGFIHTLFLGPAVLLTENVECFGRLLEKLAKMYDKLGEPMTDFEKFKNASDSSAEVNLAAVDQSSYLWLKKEAEDTYANVQAVKLRDALVDDFFEGSNAEAWLNVPDAYIREAGAGYKVQLSFADRPIPARARFEEIAAQVFPSTIQVSVVSVFNQLNQSSGKSFDAIAQNIMLKLKTRSQPLLDADLGENVFSYVMYPSALLQTADGTGVEIARAIQKAAGAGIMAYASDDADGIMFYQLAVPFEIYRIRSLTSWEKQYENGGKGYKRVKTLHGMSPDVTVSREIGKKNRYIEKLRWVDYPSITVERKNHSLKDAGGNIRHEGEMWQQLTKTVEAARNAGVLFSEQTPEGWYIKRAYLDPRLVDNWTFDLDRCPTDDNGFYPTGKKLIEAVARRNHKKMDEITAKVTLATGGIMEKAMPTEEMAWEYAARTLRAHVPMYIEVRDTLEMLKPWADAIEKVNAVIAEQFNPGKMVYMIKAGLLHLNAKTEWMYALPDGDEQIILKADAKKLNSLAMTNPREKRLLDNRFLAYVLYNRLAEEMKESETFDQALTRARKILVDLVNDDQEDLIEAYSEKCDQLFAVIEDLKKNGARLDGSGLDPKKSMLDAYPGIDKEELKKIDDFYYRMGLWEVIN